MKKLLLSTMAAFTLGTLTSQAATKFYVDENGQVFTKPAEGRKELKRYGALFTCMSSRAIHIEVTWSHMESDSFINALRRFLAVRGPVRQIRSDCGRNIIGARNELKRCFD